MTEPRYRFLSRIEIIFLAGFLFFLPLAEAPKNIFLYAFCIIWLIRCWQASAWGLPDRVYEVMLLGICLLSLVPLLHQNIEIFRAINNCVDFISIAFLLVVIARTKASSEQFSFLVAATFFGTVTALLDGLSRGAGGVYLHSVGHINQVAQYLGLMAAFTAGYLVFIRGFKRAGMAWTSLIILTALTTATGSRNTFFGLILLMAFAPLLFLLQRNYRKFACFTGGALLITSLLFISNPKPIERQISLVERSGSLIDLERAKLWRGAWLVVFDSSVFGNGVGYFGEANNPSRVEEILESRGLKFERSEYYFTNHGHNLMATWLVERGPIATALFVFWLAYALFGLAKTLTSTTASCSELRRVAAGVLVLSGSILFGVGNTSWHHEHGMLAAVAIGFGVSAWRHIKVDSVSRQQALD